MKYYTLKNHVDIEGMDCLISYTGYTGEDGYEIYTANENIEKLWNLLMQKGKKYNLTPCGLGARDTLRLEAGMPLYGHEMDDKVSPFETDLGFGVKMNKGVLREHQDIYVGDKIVGHTTSGTFSPLFKTSIAMALIDKEYSNLDSVVEVDVRGRKLKARIIELPFYKKK